MDSLLNNTTNATTAPQTVSNPFPFASLAWIFLIPIALLGNSFVIKTVFTVPEMKTPTNILFVNMSVCDIITALTMMPIPIITYFCKQPRWFKGIFGDITCRAMTYFGYTTIAGSIVALTLMAIDRFFAICYPFKRVSFFKRYKTLTVSVWLPALVIMLPIVVFSEISTSKKNGITICTTDWKKAGDVWELFFYIYVLVLLYLVPLAIMAVMYGLISIRLWFTKIPSEPLNEENQQQKKKQKKQRKIVVMLMVVLGVFAVCWFPVQIYHFDRITYDKIPPEFQSFALWLAHANSAINPCLYIILHKGFRKAFLECLYRCGLKGPVQDDETQMHPFTQSKRSTVTKRNITGRY